jgi:hypothetical protein
MSETSSAACSREWVYLVRAGEAVKIGRTKRKPVAYRFNLGDNSEVGIL